MKLLIAVLATVLSFSSATAATVPTPDNINRSSYMADEYTSISTSYSFGTADAGRTTALEFELTNVTDTRLSLGSWFGCHLCRGGFDYVNFGRFGGRGSPHTELLPGETFVFSVVFSNPMPDDFGRYGTLRLAIAAVPLPATGLMLLPALLILGFFQSSFRRRFTSIVVSD